jgi:nitroimidazol reductase NimA-like FMN-containing flavoprotein (pyridoxamine 5'-phosphate oxidase superfamily)
MKAERKTIVSFLRRHSLGTLATVGEGSLPELACVYVYMEDNLRMYFITKTKTRKLKNILAHDGATFLVTDERTFTSIEVVGKVSVVQDTLDFARIFDAFHTLFARRPGKKWLPPITQISAGKYVACQLTPTVIRYRTFNTSIQNEKRPKEVIIRPRYSSR